MNIIYLIMITVSPIFITISLYNTIEIYRKIKAVKYKNLTAFYIQKSERILILTNKNVNCKIKI